MRGFKTANYSVVVPFDNTQGMPATAKHLGSGCDEDLDFWFGAWGGAGFCEEAPGAAKGRNQNSKSEILNPKPSVCEFKGAHPEGRQILITKNQNSKQDKFLSSLRCDRNEVFNRALCFLSIMRGCFVNVTLARKV